MPNGQNIAYIRVSTTEQNEARQVEALEKHNIEKIFKEKVSAKDTNRPQLQALLDYVREGDSVFVKDFSRLARSTKDLLEIVATLEEKKVKLISLKESLDTSTPTGKLMLTMIAAIYQFERENLLERQKEGIEIAKREGKFKGRKPIDVPAEFDEVHALWKNRAITAKEAMRRLGLKPNTFYKMIKEKP